MKPNSFFEKGHHKLRNMFTGMTIRNFQSVHTKFFSHFY
jgi:hypothetical protein